jgi:hypothetical protein
MRRGLTALLLLAATLAPAQTVTRPAYSSARLSGLAVAIGTAEGFGVRGALPTRYHNPGDLKGKPDLFGAVRIGKGGHLVFKNDAAGKAALQHQLELVLDGRSRHYTLDMTLEQMARRYAKNWRNWSRYVARLLGVRPTVTLRGYLCEGDVDVAPALQFTEVARVY